MDMICWAALVLSSSDAEQSGAMLGWCGHSTAGAIRQSGTPFQSLRGFEHSDQAAPSALTLLHRKTDLVIMIKGKGCRPCFTSSSDLVVQRGCGPRRTIFFLLPAPFLHLSRSVPHKLSRYSGRNGKRHDFRPVLLRHGARSGSVTTSGLGAKKRAKRPGRRFNDSGWSCVDAHISLAAE